MENFWDILAPILVIGGIFISVFVENSKNAKKNIPDATQHPAKPPKHPSALKQALDISPKQDMPGDNIESATVQPTEKPKKKKKKAANTPQDSSVTPENDAYNQKNDETDNAMSDIRRAIIAHEILKRKF